MRVQGTVDAGWVSKHHMGWYVGRGWDSTLACRVFGEDAGKLHTPPLALISHILTLQIDSHNSAAVPVHFCPTIQMRSPVFLLGVGGGGVGWWGSKWGLAWMFTIITTS